VGFCGLALTSRVDNLGLNVVTRYLEKPPGAEAFEALQQVLLVPATAFCGVLILIVGKE
jgi:hypothetical protein